MIPVPLANDRENPLLEIFTDLHFLAPLNMESGFWNVVCQSDCMHVLLVSA
jgi:hypothetical protein